MYAIERPLCGVQSARSYFGFGPLAGGETWRATTIRATIDHVRSRLESERCHRGTMSPNSQKLKFVEASFTVADGSSGVTSACWPDEEEP